MKQGNSKKRKHYYKKYPNERHLKIKFPKG